MIENNRTTLSIDIGGSKIITGIVGEDGGVRGTVRESLQMPYTQEDILKTIINLGREAVDRYACGPVTAVAAAIPGLADPERGVWLYSSFSGIRDFPIAEKLAEEFGTAVYIDNDVKACAMGEMRFGACKNVRDFLWVTISNGIGGCAVADGKILTGGHNSAGEIGHVNVVEDGYPCGCGNRGCAEACAAGPAILRRYLERVGQTAGNAVLSAWDVARLADDGDEDARKVFEETGVYLGRAVSAAVNILNPCKVILGGGVSMSMDLFYPSLKRTMDKLVFHEANRDLSVERTALGYDAALIGAAALGFAGYERDTAG